MGIRTTTSEHPSARSVSIAEASCAIVRNKALARTSSPFSHHIAAPAMFESIVLSILERVLGECACLPARPLPSHTIQHHTDARLRSSLSAPATVQMSKALTRRHSRLQCGLGM